MEAQFASGSRGINRFQIDTIGAVIADNTIIIESGSEIFYHNRSLYFESLAAALVGQCNHLKFSLFLIIRLIQILRQLCGVSKGDLF